MVFTYDDKGENEKVIHADMQLKIETTMEIPTPSCNSKLDTNFSRNVYFFLFIMFGGLIDLVLCQWNLSNDNVSGIYLILLYLHLFFVYGQGILTFLFFFDFSEAKEIVRCIFCRTERQSREGYLEI